VSRIGNQPIQIPAGVTVKQQDQVLVYEGPKGSMTSPLFPHIEAKIEGNTLSFSRTNDSGPVRSRHGLARALAFNCVHGISSGFERKLFVKGIGYRVAVKDGTLEMHLGYSHPVNFPLPQGVSATAGEDKATKAILVTLTGVDKQVLGQTAANLRALRKPEPYKGAGIRYAEETIRLKAGKSGK
jgi:large subunit ribosomal protein L6